MGNTSNSDFQTQFKDNYAFIQVMDDSNFGLVKIYRKRQINFDYMMIYDQSLVGWNSAERNKKLRELELVRDTPHDQVLKLFYFEEIQKNSLQCKVDVIRMYIEYYNFTLENLMENNGKGRIFLDYDQILYIVNSVVSVYLYFQSIQANWFRIHPSQIFISTQGCVYFSPAQICRSLGDEFNGCTTGSSIAQDKSENLQPDNPASSYQKLYKLLMDLIEHHPLAHFQQFQRLYQIFREQTSISRLSKRVPKTTRTEIDMQKQIYRQNTSQKTSVTTMSLSHSSTNRSLAGKDDKHSLKGVRRDHHY